MPPPPKAVTRSTAYNRRRSAVNQHRDRAHSRPDSQTGAFAASAGATASASAAPMAPTMTTMVTSTTVARWEHKEHTEERKTEDSRHDERHHTESVAYRLADTPKARDQAMDIGLYGLGRMGGNMVTRLARGGHRVIAGNRSPEPVQEASKHGAVAASSIEDMAKKLK